MTGTNGKGQGYVFRHGGACWLVTAAHLFDFEDYTWGDFRVALPGTPAVTGYGEVVAPFWSGFDVATGVVRGVDATACRAAFSDLEGGWTSATPTSSLRLPFVNEGGTVRHSAMRIIDVPDHKSFLGEFTDGSEAFDGRSGSFATAAGRPAGMVITLPETDAAGRTVENTHGFVRIEEIAMNLRRYLDAQGVSLAAAAQPVHSLQEAGYAVRIHSSSLEPAGLGTSVENVLVDEAPFLFQGTGRIVLEVADGSLQNLRGVRIISEGKEAYPKAITIDIDNKSDGPFVPNWFWSGTMDQSGLFDTGERAPRQVRRIAITVSSAWGGDPRRIDRIVLY